MPSQTINISTVTVATSGLQATEVWLTDDVITEPILVGTPNLSIGGVAATLPVVTVLGANSFKCDYTLDPAIEQGQVIDANNLSGAFSDSGTNQDNNSYSGQAVVNNSTYTASTPVITAELATINIGSPTKGTPGVAQTVPISGADLSTDLVATAIPGTEVSADGVRYGPSATFPQVDGVVDGTLYVRVSSTAVVSSIAGNIPLTSAGAPTVNIAVSETTVGAERTPPHPLANQGVGFQRNT